MTQLGVTACSTACAPQAERPSIASAETVVARHGGMHHGGHDGWHHGWHREWHRAHDRVVVIRHRHHHDY